MSRHSFRRITFGSLALLGTISLASGEAPPQLSLALRAAGPELSPVPTIAPTDAALSRFGDLPSPGVFPLHWAAIQNHVSVVQRLVERGMDADSRDAEGRTPLMAAAAFGNVGMAEALLTLGADPHAKDRTLGDTAIHFAARSGYAETALLLMTHGVEPDVRTSVHGFTPLHYAAMFGHRAMIELLVSSGADANAADYAGVMPQQYASKRQRPGIVALLRSLGAREDTLHDAVNADDVGRAHALIAAGADVNEQGLFGTPLHLAAAKGHVWLLRTLIGAGADIAARGEPADGSPLHAAAMNNQTEAVKLLLAEGAEFEARDDWGRTPVMIAALFGHPSVVETLLAAGADPDARDGIYGDTAIHLAAMAGHIDIVTLFLAVGVDVNIASGHDGEAPLHYAAQSEQLDMIRFLVASGADLNLSDAVGHTPLDYAGIKSNTGELALGLLLELGARW